MTAHGLAGTYVHGCRCADCRTAHRRRLAKMRERRYAARQMVGGRLIAPLPDEQHGSASTYVNYGCRCVRCSAAGTAAAAARRSRRGAR